MSAAVWTDTERAEFIAAAKSAIKGPAETDAAARPTPRRRGGKLNAGMSVTSILAALSRVGWGPLRGREFAASRAILDTLSLIAHDSRTDLTAVIQTTARQLAKRAGYSLRHTSRCLQWLEDAGVIVWNRGGIRAGSPTVGFIKIVKRTLVDWALAFRRASDAEDRRRNAETRARLQFYRVRRNTARPIPPYGMRGRLTPPLTPPVNKLFRPPRKKAPCAISTSPPMPPTSPLPAVTETRHRIGAISANTKRSCAHSAPPKKLA